MLEFLLQIIAGAAICALVLYALAKHHQYKIGMASIDDSRHEEIMQRLSNVEQLLQERNNATNR